MTYEEVMQRLQLSVDYAMSGQMGVLDEETLKEVAMLELSIKALEKQMPKQPEILRCNEDVRIGNRIWKVGTSVMKCGSCGEWVVPHWKYCSECGQRIGGSDGKMF